MTTFDIPKHQCWWWPHNWFHSPQTLHHNSVLGFISSSQLWGWSPLEGLGLHEDVSYQSPNLGRALHPANSWKQKSRTLSSVSIPKTHLLYSSLSALLWLLASEYSLILYLLPNTLLYLKHVLHILYTFLSCLQDSPVFYTAGNKFLLLRFASRWIIWKCFFSFQTYGVFQTMLLLISKFITLLSESGVYMISVPWYLLRFLLWAIM